MTVFAFFLLRTPDLVRGRVCPPDDEPLDEPLDVAAGADAASGDDAGTAAACCDEVDDAAEVLVFGFGGGVGVGIFDFESAFSDGEAVACDGVADGLGGGIGVVFSPSLGEVGSGVDEAIGFGGGIGL